MQQSYGSHHATNTGADAIDILMDSPNIGQFNLQPPVGVTSAEKLNKLIEKAGCGAHCTFRNKADFPEEVPVTEITEKKKTTTTDIIYIRIRHKTDG